MPNRLQDIDYTGGYWWRFDRYEINDGYIRPAKGANLERYSPWQTNLSETAPYESALALADTLRTEMTDDPWDLPAAVSEHIISWCVEFGLPGILVHRLQQVSFAARWETQPKNESWGAKPGSLVPAAYTYYRTNAGWGAGRSISTDSPPDGMAPVRGDLVTEDQIAGIEVRPKVLVRDMLTGEPKTINNLSFWQRYFPSIPLKARSKARYPIPLTEDFWRLYAEPVTDFINTTDALARAVMGAFRWKKGADQYDEIHSHMGWLNTQVFGVSPFAGALQDGSIGIQWVSPSLIASLATMALQDLSEQKQVLRCENCRRPFVTEAYQARYCSKTCRYAVNKRVYRSKLKARAASKK